MRTWSARLVALGASFTCVSAGLLGGLAAPAFAAGCGSGVARDVNGDGHAEVVISDRNQANAGTVHVLYGQPGGLVADAQGTALDDQHLHQDSPGVPGAAEADDEFGFSTVFGDFNADGCADLAVSVPGEDRARGRVVVFSGSPAGLRTTGVQSLSETSLFGAGAGQPDEGFGFALAAADLDRNGVEDLVVGVPFEQVGGIAAGAVAVVPGSAGGLGSGKPALLLSQSSTGVSGVPEEGDGFGVSLAPGDFDGNGATDLAVGVPGENGHGTAMVLDGSGTAPGQGGSTVLSQRTAGVAGAAEEGDAFGLALAAGDITGDGRDDLAVGIPRENRDPEGEDDGEGAVVMLPGSSTGVTTRESQLWSQASPGVGGTVGGSDGFGSSLVIAPLDADRYADLAVAAPADSVGRVFAAGSVTVLRGGAAGLTTAGSGGRRFHQDTEGIAGVAGVIDLFGQSITAAPVQSRTQHSLVVGVPVDVVGGRQSGRVHQLAITPAGPEGVGSRSFHHDTPGVKGRAGGGFGSAVG